MWTFLGSNSYSVCTHKYASVEVEALRSVFVCVCGGGGGGGGGRQGGTHNREGSIDRIGSSVALRPQKL